MELKEVRLALVFKDFAAWCLSSGVGLNVAGYATASVLNRNGIRTTVFPVRHNIDLAEGIKLYNETHVHRLTHVVISAPWLSVYDLKTILRTFWRTKFVILSHSNVGFLQADPCGMQLIHQYMELTKEFPNLAIAANSNKLYQWFRETLKRDALLLPNLYPIDEWRKEKHWTGTIPLKIGAFGVVRPEKNFMSAAAAALTIQRWTGITVELHMSCGGEGGGERTEQAIGQLVFHNRGLTLVKHPWLPWPEFTELISQMDLLLQPSFTESFNMITADGILMGVASVVSPAIEWAPSAWKADPDDALSIAKVGLRLLQTANIGEGRRALERHNEASLDCWQEWLLESGHHRGNRERGGESHETFGKS